MMPIINDPPPSPSAVHSWHHPQGCDCWNCHPLTGEVTESPIQDVVMARPSTASSSSSSSSRMSTSDSGSPPDFLYVALVDRQPNIPTPPRSPDIGPMPALIPVTPSPEPDSSTPLLPNDPRSPQPSPPFPSLASLAANEQPRHITFVSSSSSDGSDGPEFLRPETQTGRPTRPLPQRRRRRPHIII